MKFLTTILMFLIIYSTHAEVKFASYNIRTFDSKSTNTDKKELKKILQQLDADFLTVQEIINTSSFKSFIKKEFPEYRVILSKCGGAGKQMIGFVYKSAIFSMSKIIEDDRIANPTTQQRCARLRPALIGHFTYRPSNTPFTAIGLHLKAGGTSRSYAQRKIQYSQIKEMLAEFRSENRKNIIIMGDLNTTGYVHQDTDYKNFSNMLQTINLDSISEDLSCTSYWSGTDIDDGKEESSILDHILHQRVFLGLKKSKVEVLSHCKRSRCANVSDRTLGRSYKKVSDHCPIAITME